MSHRSSVAETAPLPEKGTRVLLDGLPGGPWSSVVEALSGQTLVVDAPRLGGRPVALPVGRRFTVNYSWREVPCEVDAEIAAAPSAVGGRGYAVRILSEVRRMQRRRAVRIPVHLMARVGIEGAADDDQEPLAAITEDLSAGGVLLRTADQIAAGSPLTVTILCGGEAGAFEVHGKVIRCDRIDVEERPFRVAVAFVDVAAADEDRLVRFIFEQQREMRRRDAGLT